LAVARGDELYVKILAVHSTSPSLGVAVTDDGRVLAERVLPAGRAHLENLAPLIRTVLAELEFDIDEIAGFGIARGPGTFSGIRVGMATVKGLALALGKPVAGISSLEILAWQGLSEGESGPAVIDARRRSVFVAGYRREKDNITLLNGPLLIEKENIGEFASAIAGPLTLCSDTDASLFADAVPLATGCRIVTPSPAACATLAWKRLIRGDDDNPHSLTPLYLRRSDAEEKRRSVNPGKPVPVSERETKAGLSVDDAE
jgi:tRNA threonylcarbamoyladenosine biosynthesis protein TsaB